VVNTTLTLVARIDMAADLWIPAPHPLTLPLPAIFPQDADTISYNISRLWYDPLAIAPYVTSAPENTRPSGTGMAQTVRMSDSVYPNAAGHAVLADDRRVEIVASIPVTVHAHLPFACRFLPSPTTHDERNH
jgi:hypothetical protein